MNVVPSFTTLVKFLTPINNGLLIWGFLAGSVKRGPIENIILHNLTIRYAIRQVTFQIFILY